MISTKASVNMLSEANRTPNRARTRKLTKNSMNNLLKTATIETKTVLGEA